MATEIALVVTDASPLITLAVAASLDYLLYSGLPVLVPDAVFHEATASAGRLGATEILRWYDAHRDRVRVEPTEIFQRETMLIEERGGRLSRDTGERAALEVIRRYPLLDQQMAMLLCDDRDAERLFIADPRKVAVLTTWDYLRELEAAQRIQSADNVIDLVRAAGREPATRSLWDGHDPEVRDAVRAVLRGSTPER